MLSKPTCRQSKHLIVSFTSAEKLNFRGSSQHKLLLLVLSDDAVIQPISISGMPSPVRSIGFIDTAILSSPAAVGLSLFLTVTICDLVVTLPHWSSNDQSILCVPVGKSVFMATICPDPVLLMSISESLSKSIL